MGFDGVGSMEPFAGLSKRAARVLIVARQVAADDGEVDGGQPRLAQTLGVSARHVRRALADLEDAGLARRVGQNRVFVSTAQVRIGPPSSGEVPSERHPDAPVDPRKDPEWRSLRARVGGLQRALEEVQEQRDAARAAQAALEKEARRQSRLGVSPDVVALGADLAHRADCLDPECDRCLAIVQRIEEERPRYAREDEIVERIERGALLESAARLLLRAQGARDVGARRRAALAAHAMRAIVDGDRSAAARLVHEAERA